MGLFDNKVVIVTGGALGIGRDTAIAFSREGAAVAIVDINVEPIRSVVAEIRRGGSQIPILTGDVSSAAACENAVDFVAKRFGGVDILFNNVGIQPLDSYADVVDTSEETWDRIMAVNLKSCFLMAKYAIPEMRKRGGGVIINNASVQGLASMPKVPAYAASKGAILSLTRAMALDHARENIRVVAICPGTIDTDMVRTAARAEGGDVEATLARWGRMHPIGRIGIGEDIASAVLFLASDQAAFITGAHLLVDGGYMAEGVWARGPGAAK